MKVRRGPATVIGYDGRRSATEYIGKAPARGRPESQETIPPPLVPAYAGSSLRREGGQGSTQYFFDAYHEIKNHRPQRPVFPLGCLTMKVFRIVTVIFVVFIFGCAVPPPERAAVETVVVTDDLGRVVEVPRRPGRIVSTSPEATEMLFAVGAGENVVGVTTWCNYPPEARELPKVGDFSNIDMEKVAALEPDLVIATGHEQGRTVENLERLGFPVVVFLAPDVNGVRENIRAVGEITGREDGAAEVLADFDGRLAAVDAAVAEIPDGERVSVFIEISNEPLMTVSDGSFVADMIKRAGGVNIGEGLPRAYSRIDPEEVVRRNPDVIVLASGATPDDVSARVGWSSIMAVREGRVYAGFDEDLLFRAGPRAAEGVELLYEMFYGD